MEQQLTAGICARLHNIRDNDDPVLQTSPTVQFLSLKRVPPIPGSSATVDRYRIIVSDGEHFLQAMMATQLNHLVEEGQVTKHSIIIMERFSCNVVQEKRSDARQGPRMHFYSCFAHLVDCSLCCNSV